MDAMEIKSDYADDIMSKFDKMRENFEAAVSEQAKVTIKNLLNRINALSDVEKLVLYLQLPDGVQPDEPQKVVPPAFQINNQLEQSQAFTWIVSHLEMDKDTCLRKDEVFEDYEGYCRNHNIKPLNTADFGKVMKRAFPDVKPRRLGMRGQSKYCYGGLRKKTEVATPALPNIVPYEEDIKDKLSDMLAECTSIVVGWAETVLGQGGFVVLRHLAEYLVANRYTDSRSIAAMTLRRDGYKYVDEDGVTLEKFRNATADKLQLEVPKSESQPIPKLPRRESPLTSSTEPGSVDTCDGGTGSVFNTPNARRSLPSVPTRVSNTPQASATHADPMIPPQTKRELLKLPGVFPKGISSRADAFGTQPAPPVPVSCASNQPMTLAGDSLQAVSQASKPTGFEQTQTQTQTQCKYSPMQTNNSIAPETPSQQKVAVKRRSLPLSSVSSNESEAVNVPLAVTPLKRARLSLDSADPNEYVPTHAAHHYGSPSVTRDAANPYAQTNDYAYRRPPSPGFSSMMRNESHFSSMQNTVHDGTPMIANASYTAMLLSDGRTPYMTAAQMSNAQAAAYMQPGFASTHGSAQRMAPNTNVQRSCSPSAFSSYRPFSPSGRTTQNMGDDQHQQYAKRGLYTSPFESVNAYNALETQQHDAGDRNCFQQLLQRVGPSPGSNANANEHYASAQAQVSALQTQTQTQPLTLTNLSDFASYAAKTGSDQPSTPPKPDSTSSSLSVGIGSPQQISDASAEQQNCTSILQDTQLATDPIPSSHADVKPTCHISPTAHRERRFDIGTPEEHRVTSTTRELHERAPQQGLGLDVLRLSHPVAAPAVYANLNLATAAAAAASTDSTRVASVIQSCLSILKDLDPEYVTMYEQQQLGFRQRLVGPANDMPPEAAIPVGFGSFQPNSAALPLPPPRVAIPPSDNDLKPNVEAAIICDKLRKDELNTPTPPNSQYSSPDSSEMTSGMSTSNNASSLINSITNLQQHQQLLDCPPTIVPTNNNVRKASSLQPAACSLNLNALPHS